MGRFCERTSKENKTQAAVRGTVSMSISQELVVVVISPTFLFDSR